MTTEHRAVIIDDESHLRDLIAIKLEKMCPQIKVVGQANDGIKGYELIQKTHPDIVLLDIEMPRCNGFEMLQKFDGIDFEIIFITGYNDYALKALKISAVDYLLKPVINEDLQNAIEKAEKRIAQKQNLAHYELLQHNIGHQGKQSSRVNIPGTNSIDIYEISDIIHCEGDQGYTRLFLNEGRKLMSSYNLGVFRELLNPYGFFSTHKSHLINMAHVKHYVNNDHVLMSNDSEVPVSRRKREEFKELLLKSRVPFIGL